MFSILVSLGQWVHVCLFTHLYPCLSVLIMDTSYHTNRSRKSVHRQEHAPNLPVQRSGQPLNCRCPFYRVQFNPPPDRCHQDNFRTVILSPNIGYDILQTSVKSLG